MEYVWDYMKIQKDVRKPTSTENLRLIQWCLGQFSAKLPKKRCTYKKLCCFKDKGWSHHKLIWFRFILFIHCNKLINEKRKINSSIFSPPYKMYPQNYVFIIKTHVFALYLTYCWLFYTKMIPSTTTKRGRISKDGSKWLHKTLV